MKNISPDRLKLLGQVAYMYFIQGMTQKEIAAKIHVSRSNVSRMIKTCRENNIVKINVNFPSTAGE